MLVALWLIIGDCGTSRPFIATRWMLILIVLVASGNSLMLTDPYGAGERFLPDRVRDHSVDTSHELPLLPDIKNEFKDQPKGKQLSEESGGHLHRDVAMNLERIDNGYFQNTGGVVSANKQDQSHQPLQTFPASRSAKNRGAYNQRQQDHPQIAHRQN